MTALIVIGCILAALVLIGQIRIGAAVSWSEDGLSLRIRFGPLSAQILPAREKREPKAKKKPKKETQKKSAKKQPAPEEKPKKGAKDTLSMVRQFLPLLAEAAGRLRRKIRIDRLNLYVVWGASNPAAAAMGYGAANAVVGMLWPVIDHTFLIKEHQIRVDVDFERKSPALAVDAQAALTVGQGLSLALRAGIKAIKIYLGHRREKMKQKAVQA